jgi:hypothetical protein
MKPDATRTMREVCALLAAASDKDSAASDD